MKKIYTRKVKGGGIHIYQLIAGGLVFTLSKNTSWQNGNKHNWIIQVKLRNKTAL